MARVANYEAKIEALKERIEKKEQELDKLQRELEVMLNQYNQVKNQELFELMDERGLTASDTVDIIRRALDKENQ